MPSSELSTAETVDFGLKVVGMFVAALWTWWGFNFFEKQQKAMDLEIAHAELQKIQSENGKALQTREELKTWKGRFGRSDVVLRYSISMTNESASEINVNCSKQLAWVGTSNFEGEPAIQINQPPKEGPGNETDAVKWTMLPSVSYCRRGVKDEFCKDAENGRGATGRLMPGASVSHDVIFHVDPELTDWFAVRFEYALGNKGQKDGGCGTWMAMWREVYVQRREELLSEGSVGPH